jgi:hypothetical protein
MPYVSPCPPIALPYILQGKIHSYGFPRPSSEGPRSKNQWGQKMREHEC